MIKLIYSKNLNNAIGINNTLPWTIKEDLQRFKELTTGHTVVMGRRTFESLPEAVRPLPGRRNVVLANESWNHPQKHQVLHVKSLSELHTSFNTVKAVKGNDVFIIGGSTLFNTFMPIAEVIHETIVLNYDQGDAFVTPVDYKIFDLKQSSAVFTAKDSGILYQYRTYHRKL